jgi:epoxyqueuosine reductase
MPEKNSTLSTGELDGLAVEIRQWSQQLGFQQTGISDIDLSRHQQHLEQWLSKHYHGEMQFMEKHGSKRSHPEQLLPGTLRAITVRMDYLPTESELQNTLHDGNKAYISRYALGRDYHKLMRKRLAKLAEKISSVAGPHNHRAFVDSAPVLERGLAEKSGLGWIGKNTMLINSEAGSWFFLGEIFTDLPLPPDPPQQDMHCGTCTACLDDCPTGAIVAPHQVDARRCISYLTIELKGSIPLELRPLMGNRIYGCDDCQLVCPWNKFATASAEEDFQPRNDLQSAQLLSLFEWSEEEFLTRTEGSAIRRIGYQSWIRNIAVALGNAPFSDNIINALNNRMTDPSQVIKEHVDWALNQQQAKRDNTMARV